MSECKIDNCSLAASHPTSDMCHLHTKEAPSGFMWIYEHRVIRDEIVDLTSNRRTKIQMRCVDCGVEMYFGYDAEIDKLAHHQWRRLDCQP